MILFFTMQGVIQCRTATGYDNELNERKELHVILMFYLRAACYFNVLPERQSR